MINYDKLKKEYQDISQALSQEDIFKDRAKYTQLSKRFSFLEKICQLIQSRQECVDQLQSFQDVLADNKEEEEIKRIAQEEIPALKERISQLEEDIEDKLFQGESYDRDVIIEIRAAAGGEESALFAATLFEMYSKYSDAQGWKIEVLSAHDTEIGGFKEVMFSVRGTGVYAHLKYESGVHRVQRVPVTESGGRIHTSTVTVAVLMEPKEVDLKINPEDLKIDTFRSSGAGGQHVNVTDSAVRITYLPTNTVVTCQDERSQLKNREKGMRVLKARIMDNIRQTEEKKISSERRTQIGTGERSEKIRTYNYPERRVTDHRVNFTLYRLEAVLAGDLEELVKKLTKEERRKIYEAKGLA